MECKIGKRGAKWLALALRAGADPNMPFSVVNVLRIGGRMYAGASDGYRLHVLEVSENLLEGPYTIDVANGLLTSTVLDYGAPMAWAAVVPHASDLTGLGLQVDQADFVNIAGNVCYQLLPNGTANVKCNFVDQALTGNYGYVVRCNYRDYGPIKIEFLVEQVTRYAVLIPIRSKQAVRV